MFEAWLLVCMLSNPNACFEASDTRGPYLTRQQCVDRSMQMAKDIETLPDHSAIAFKCVKVKGRTPA